jgi:MarR family transcriptional regulator, 2-MHQ and catechol-resistance regulon repressor
MSVATTTGLLERDTRALYDAVSDLVRLVQFRDRDRICCHDVSVTQCYGLESLVRRGPLSLGALAAELYLDKSTTSRVVDALERKGYARRDPDPDDARGVRVSATAEGRKLHGRIEGNILREERAILESFPPDVRRSMTELLRRLVGAMASRSNVPAPSCCTR